MGREGLCGVCGKKALSIGFLITHLEKRNSLCNGKALEVHNPRNF
jgi:hypothetical protein